MDVQKRAQEEAKAVARKEAFGANRLGYWSAIIAALLALAGGAWTQFGTVVSVQNRVETLEQRLERELDVGDRFEALDARIRQLELEK